MAADHLGEASDEMLRAFLRAQRESVLAIVEGLSEQAWHSSVVPTGWTPAGMLQRSHPGIIDRTGRAGAGRAPIPRASVQISRPEHHL